MAWLGSSAIGPVRANKQQQRSFYHTMSRVSPTLHQLAQAWPVDPLRPTVQFGQVLAGLSTSPNLSLRAVMATRALSEDRLKTQV